MKKVSLFTPSVPNMKYHAHDWNIVTKSEKEKERIDGLYYLSSSHFLGRCVEYYIYSSKYIINNLKEIEDFLHNRWFFVVITGKSFKRKIILVKSTEDLICKINELNLNLLTTDLLFVFINMIQKCSACSAGVVFSDGDRELRVELMPDSVNTRDLTDGTKDASKMIYLESEILSLKIIHGKNNEYIFTKEFSHIIAEIARCCHNNRGYYEFIFGLDQNFNFPNLFFTYFSFNERYGMNKNHLWDEYRS